MKLAQIGLITAISVVLAACDSSGPGGSARPKPGASSPAFGAAAAPVVAVKVEPVRATRLEHTLLAYGTVEYSPEGARIHSVQGEGRVATVRVAVGQEVKAGTELLLLEPTANARLELDKARIDVEFARKDVARLTDLRARELATNAEVKAAEKALAMAEAALENVRRRQVGDADRSVRTRMDGVVIAVSAQAGQVVAPGTELVRIADRQHLRVRLGVEQEDLSKVHAGEMVRLSPLNIGARHYSGTIERVDPQIDPKSRLAEAIVPLQATDGLIPGAMVRATIVVAVNTHALVVPRSAVLYQSGRPYVFVVAGEHARQQWIEAGEDNGQVVEVLKGLNAGDPVVTLGNAELHDGAAVRRDAAP